MRDSAKLFCRAVIEKVPHLLSHADAPQFLAQADVVSKLFLELVPLWILVRLVHRPLRLGMRFSLIHQVRHPGCDRFNDHLSTLAFQELEHVEVAVAFGDLRPEFTGDLHHRLHPHAVHFNGVHSFSRGVQRLEIVLAPHVLVPLAKHVESIA